jgi:sarcosine oxidase
MSTRYDVIVAGLGAMGGAACDQLAGRGLSVLGLDRFAPPHTQGSSHGESRIIREAYFEDPRYVPLVQRAYECWADLARDTGRKLLLPTGGLMIGERDGVLVSGAVRSAETHSLRYELLDASEMRSQYPMFELDDSTVAVWEPRAGVLDPEACVTAQLERAARRGADLRTSTAVDSWHATSSGVEVKTSHGVEHAAQLVLAAGSWLPTLAPSLASSLAIERIVAYWFDPVANAELFAPERFPIWIWEHEKDRFIYGFPRLARGVKIARHHEGETCTADTVRRAVAEEETSGMRALTRRRLPALDGALLGTATCLYTNTPDGEFVIDRHPGHEQVLIVSACSGHGFKFASVIGEVVADLVTHGRSRFDLEPFRLARLISQAKT